MNTIVTLPGTKTENIVLSASASKLSTEHDHLEEIRQSTINLTPDKRKEYVSTITIPYPKFTQAIDLMESYYHQSGHKDPGGVCIYGDSGMGKSYIVTHFMMKHESIVSDEKTTIPILYLKLNAAMAPSDLLKALLTILGNPFTQNKSNTELTEDLTEGIKQREVKVIVFDEANAFGEGTGNSRPAFIGNALKRVHDDTGVPQIYLGVDKDLKRFFSLAQQLEERITSIHELTPFEYDNNFIGFLKAFDCALPMLNQANLAENYSKKIHTATNGNLRKIRRLLAYAVLYAASDNAPALTDKYFTQAYLHVFGTGENPFAD